MGHTISKKSHLPVSRLSKCSAIVNVIPNANYSLTFSGCITLNDVKKSKKPSYDSAYCEITKHEFWTRFIDEVMHESIQSLLHTSMGYSIEVPLVSELSIILDEKKRNSQNIVSGTIFWKSMRIDSSVIAECIADKFLYTGTSVNISDSKNIWEYHFTPGKLSF